MRLLRIVGSGSTLLLLAVVLGLATTAATYGWLTTRTQPEAAAVGATGAGEVTTQPVVVLREGVAAGTALPAALLEVRQIASTQLLPGALSAVDQAVDRVARYPMVAGEQVLDSRLVGAAATGRGLAFSVPEGMRAISVPVSEVSAAGGLIVPGDRVDVLAATSYERLFEPQAEVGENTRRGVAVVTVLQDVLVLAVGQEATAPIDSGRDPETLRPDGSKPQPSARSVTVAVTPAQAQALFMASTEGTLGLAVRPFGDVTRSPLAPLTSLQPAGDFDRVNRAP
ncbi:MAG: Flp pilus assembly protein CpaB [Chloroflexi bacterium]|nr:Flp pilus assembly protein CpaB [Chloroflexota bacterium]MDA1003903.1 Flp pilus assembly protein CpaB [Chloroflexota bacterium]